MAQSPPADRWFDIGTAAVRFQEAFGRFPTRLELWNFTRESGEYNGVQGLNANLRLSPGSPNFDSPNAFPDTIGTSAGSFSFAERESLDIDQSATLDDTEVNFGLRYGHLVPLLDIPEIRNIAQRAISEDLSPEEIQSQIAQSEWAQSRSAREREAEILQRSDPGTWSQEMRNQTERVTRITSSTLTGLLSLRELEGPHEEDQRDSTGQVGR